MHQAPSSLTNKQNLFNRKIMTMKAGYTQASLALALGITGGAICHVYKCKTKNRALQERIAALLGVSLAEFWPELYGPELLSSIPEPIKEVNVNAQQ